MEDTHHDEEEPMEYEEGYATNIKDCGSLFDINRIQADKAEEGRSDAISRFLYDDKYEFNKDNKIQSVFANYELTTEDLIFDGREIGRGVSCVHFKRGYFMGYGREIYTTAAVKRLTKSHKEEVRILRKLQHPNIIGFITYLEEPNLHFLLVTEFAEFGSLIEVLKSKRDKSEIPLPREWFLKWSFQLVSAVEYLHQKYIFHRDIKSGNILVCSDHQKPMFSSHRCVSSSNVLKLCDFGLSREIGDGVSHITTSVGKGTHRWMAPEVFKHQHHSEASDVFSMSMVFLEMCTGKLPFSDIKIAASVSWKVAQEGLRPDIPYDCPVFLQNLLEECWSADPQRRPKVADIKHVVISAMPGDLAKEILNDR